MNLMHMIGQSRKCLKTATRKGLRFLSLQMASKQTLMLSDKCVAQINNLKKKHGENMRIRVGVDSGGCSGYMYDFKIDTLPVPEEDFIIERDGSQVVIDQMSYTFVKGATLDFIAEMVKSSFAVVDNPNVEQGCGCGISFANKGDSKLPAFNVPLPK